MMRYGFAQCHPAVNFLFFTAAVTGMLMLSHPVFVGICFVCAVIYVVFLSGCKGLVFSLGLLPLVAVFALYYSSYHHFGVTILFYNRIGNAITLESLVYGLVLGIKLAGVAIWFSCIHAIFTTDKVVYLFGAVSPLLSLFLSMLLRMVPRLKRQVRRIHTAQKGIGRGMGQGNILRRLHNLIRIFSATVTWFIETCVTLSDAMACRGSRLGGRTAFSIYRFDNRDRTFVVAMFLFLTVTIMGILLQQTQMQYDPRLVFPTITPMSWLFLAGFSALCLMPFVLDVITDLKFRKAGKLL